MHVLLDIMSRNFRGTTIKYRFNCWNSTTIVWRRCANCADYHRISILNLDHSANGEPPKEQQYIQHLSYWVRRFLSHRPLWAKPTTRHVDTNAKDSFLMREENTTIVMMTTTMMIQNRTRSVFTRGKFTRDIYSSGFSRVDPRIW